jgi:DNA repair ATPase RecN
MRQEVVIEALDGLRRALYEQKSWFNKREHSFFTAAGHSDTLQRIDEKLRTLEDEIEGLEHDVSVASQELDSYKGDLGLDNSEIPVEDRVVELKAILDDADNMIGLVKEVRNSFSRTFESMSPVLKGSLAKIKKGETE